MRIFFTNFCSKRIDTHRDILTLKITHSNHSFELILEKCRHHGTTIENTGNTVLIQQQIEDGYRPHIRIIFAVSMLYFFLGYVYVGARAMMLSAGNILQFDGRAASYKSYTVHTSLSYQNVLTFDLLSNRILSSSVK
jgi:hypothetical protein